MYDNQVGISYKLLPFWDGKTERGSSCWIQYTMQHIVISPRPPLFLQNSRNIVIHEFRLVLSNIDTLDGEGNTSASIKLNNFVFTGRDE